MSEAIQDIPDHDDPVPAESRWDALSERLQTRMAEFVERKPAVFMGLASALTLLGYVVPLIFPIATLMAALNFISALQEFGFTAFSTHPTTLGVMVFGALMSVSLWKLRVGEPEGEPLTTKQVPALFEHVDEIRSAFQAPAINDIHLAEHPELTVHRVPRTGYPFMFRHVLVAGLPTLQCLNQEQFKCLLAACLGELSAVRTDVAGWITQMARTWRLYRSAVATQWTPAALLYRAFLSWYAPLLTLVAKRLDRHHRLLRDHYALEVASDDLVLEMIAGEMVMQRFLNTIYWPTVYKTAEHSSTPNFKVFRNLETVFRRRVSQDEIQVWVREAFVGKWQSDEDDPGLKARLREVGHSDIHYQRSDAPGAAQVLLGSSYQWVIDRCDARWAEDHREEWAERHHKTRRQYGKLDMLRDVLQRHGLKGEEAMQYAALVKRYGTPDEAREAYDTILKLNPNDARINFGVGKYLLAQKDARGVKILEHAMKLDKRFVDPACRLISGFVVNHKLQDTVRKFVRDEGKGKQSSAA